MKMLIIEPLLERGMRVRITDGVSWKAERLLEHGQDIVAAIHALGHAGDNCEAIVVRGKIGSFSASRTALIAGTTLSATRGIELIITEAKIETVSDLYRALTHAKKKFEYEHPPNIS